MTYSNTIPIPDFRRQRAEALAAALLKEVEDVTRDPEHRAEDIFYRLFDVLHRNGAAWTTDEERERFGFEPRDHKGWTGSERVEHERRKAEAMQMMQAHMFSGN